MYCVFWAESIINLDVGEINHWMAKINTFEMVSSLKRPRKEQKKCFMLTPSCFLLSQKNNLPQRSQSWLCGSTFTISIATNPQLGEKEIRSQKKLYSVSKNHSLFSTPPLTLHFYHLAFLYVLLLQTHSHLLLVA